MPDCAIQLSQNMIVCLLASDQSKTIKYNKWRICKIFIAVRVTNRAEIAKSPSIAFFATDSDSLDSVELFSTEDRYAPLHQIADHLLTKLFAIPKEMFLPVAFLETQPYAEVHSLCLRLSISHP